jgi:phage tail-like protein
MNLLQKSALVLIGLFLPSLSLPLQATRKIGPGPFTIKVEIEGVTQGVFQAVDGLISESEVVDQEEAGVLFGVPGNLKSTRLVLKRPYDPEYRGLWHWRQSVVEGDPQRRDGHIFIFNARGQSVAHWIFHKGWPSRWEVPSVSSSPEEPAVEIIEIVHQGLTLQE